MIWRYPHLWKPPLLERIWPSPWLAMTHWCLIGRCDAFARRSDFLANGLADRTQWILYSEVDDTWSYLISFWVLLKVEGQNGPLAPENGWTSACPVSKRNLCCYAFSRCINLHPMAHALHALHALPPPILAFFLGSNALSNCANPRHGRRWFGYGMIWVCLIAA